MKQNIYVPYSFDKLCNNFSYKTLRQECYKELSKVFYSITFSQVI